MPFSDGLQVAERHYIHWSSTAHPRPGDVVVSRKSALTEHDVSIVAHPARAAGRRDDAIAIGCELAEQLRVDAWVTEDHTHFIRLSPHRPPER